MSDGRICLIIPHLVTNVDRELVSGIFLYLKRCNYDLFIITGISNFQNQKEKNSYIDGIQNIYSLIKQANFDGVIFAADCFTNQKIKQDIYKYLIRRDIPVVVLEEENKYFPYLYPEQKSAIYQITSHLIKEHNCRKIYFLSGIKGHYSSVERQNGYESAMRENNLFFTEDDIFYGDFCKEKPAALGKKIADGIIEMPDAVVCADDTMALSLIRSLKKYGIKVPDDIKVTGYDGITEAFLNSPQLTTVAYRNYQFGYNAAAKLYNKIYPERIKAENTIKGQTIQLGTSCGCGCEKTELNKSVWNDMRRLNAFRFEYYNMMATDFFRKLTDNGSLEELMSQAADFSYRIPNWKSFCVCLCEDWKFDFSEPTKFRTSGYSDKMLVALEKPGLHEKADCYKNYIRTSDIIPENLIQKSPSVYLLTSLHSNGQIFGYICTSYNNPENIYLDSNYCNWCDTLNRGIQEVQRKIYHNYIRKELDTRFDVDPETGFLSRHGLIQKIPDFISSNSPVVVAALMIKNTDYYDSLNMSNLISSAFRNTSSENELYSKIRDDLYILVMPLAEGESQEWAVYKRIDKMENEIMKYDTGGIHIKLPDFIISFSTFTGNINFDFNETIEKQIILSESFTSKKNDYYNELMRLRRKIKMNPEYDWSLKSVTGITHISKSHFQRLYRATFGCTCTQDVIRFRVAKSKRLLKFTDMTIRQISDVCGYEYTNHFMRQFRKEVGTTAMQFREKELCEEL